MSSLNELQAAALRTIMYFDTFDYPVTTAEVERWLYPRPGQTLPNVNSASVSAALASLRLQQKIEETGEYWHCPERSAIVQLRRDRQIENQRKWRRALTTAQYLEIVPFVRMVAVVNTLALNNARPQSDIDLMIVVKAGHLWLTRLFVTGIVQLLGYRRHGHKIANRICLSFYVTDDGLDLEGYRSADPDHHYIFWTAQAVPLLDHNQTYERYRKANSWVTKYLPNAWGWNSSDRLLPPNGSLTPIRGILEAGFSSTIGSWLENWLREMQRRKMEKNAGSRRDDESSDVVVSDTILKFHEADRRAEYNQRFEARLKELGV